MAADATLAALFDLPVVYEPLCDAASCKSIVGYLREFCTHVTDITSCMDEIELGALDEAIKILQSAEPCQELDWMPEYGCALMKSTAECPSGEVALNLIALDLHRFQSTSKSSPSGYAYVDTAFAVDYEVLHIGTCTLKELPERLSAFQSLLTSAQNRTGDERSARGGKQGHQRTPAFIHALYRQVFSGLQEIPRGGMTDVGLHTGGKRRSTSGPLVFSSFRQILEDNEAKCVGSFSSNTLFQKVTSYFGLFISKVMIAQYDKKTAQKVSNAPDIFLEHAFHILQSTSIKAASISNDGLDMSYFVEWLRQLKGEIMTRASKASADYSKQFKLPQSDAEIRGCYENFLFNLPLPYSAAKDDVLDESKIYQKELQNLGWLNIPEKDGRLRDIQQWVKKTVAAANQDSLLAILLFKRVERFMWSCAKNLPVMDENELELVASIVDDYRGVFKKFKDGGKYLSLSIVQLKSRELLIVWVAYCIIHSNAVRMHGVAMRGFGVPLDLSNLSHLNLSNREEWDVVKRIAIYLHEHGINKPLFSLKEEKHTFEMALRFANASPSMQKIWREETQDALARIEGHWKEVQRKQEQARKLRQEISELTVERADVNRKLVSETRDLEELNYARRRRHRYSWASYDSYRHQECRNKVNSLTSTLSSLDSSIRCKNSSLESALKAPAPVIQPLPEDTNNAMPVIFFLYMPKVFQLLSRFSFTAQQLLVPQPWTSVWGGQEGSETTDITSIVTRKSNAYCQYSWKDHYNVHQSSQYHHPSCSRVGSDYCIMLRSVVNCVPQDVGSSSVDNMHDKRNGIWFPDQLKPRMAWFGGANVFDKSPGGYEFNPFAPLNHFQLVANFTERLPANGHLQWSLMQPGDNHIHPSRGNLPYARQSQKPSWLTKTEFISFTNLRSHPNNQLRNIFVAIHEHQLPLSKQYVHLLIRQSLFHIGELCITNSSATFEWKRDLDDSSFCNHATMILDSLYHEIKDTPKNYLCVKFIGQLCNFFSAWAPACRDIARQLAKSVYGWAEQVGRGIDKAAPSMIPEIRAKQVVLYQHAMLVLASGSLDRPDVALLIEMLVKSKNLFTGEHRDSEIRTNGIELNYHLCQKLNDILEVAGNNPVVMTDAVRSFLPRLPTRLDWKQFVADGDSSTQCFKSQGSDGHSYTINLLTGEVLINGLPPSRLPLSILKHLLYQQSFGDRQFEVVAKGGFLETCRPVFGRYYRFSTGSSLKIYEFKGDGSEMLELLDVTDNESKWSKDIPPRLTIMHSHWLYRARHAIVLRDICFKDRNVSYMVKLESAAAGGIVKGEVKCVEPHQEGRDQLSRLMKDIAVMDTLVRHSSAALDILSKFENKQFIHSLIKHDGSFKFYFPRYKLTLQLYQGVLHCQEIAGYQLMAQQQTDETLRGTSMYLLLEKVGSVGPKLIVFPEGKVVREYQKPVYIDVTGSCDAELLWYQYEYHPRFKYIETKQSRASRMQLAALHISTTSPLPDTLLGMTGEERAITMIRQCWTNRPLSDQECAALSNIEQLSHGRSPALSVLCHGIKKSAQQLPFLFVHNNNFQQYNQCFAGTAYLNNVKNKKIGSRCYLTKREEAQIIGTNAKRPSHPLRFAPTQTLPICSVGVGDIKPLQKAVEQLHSDNNHENKKQKISHDSFPLNIKPSSKLELDMINELKESWSAYQTSITCHAASTGIDTRAVEVIQTQATELRQKAEDYALSALNDVPQNNSHWHNNAQVMLRIAGVVPTATVADLARIAIDSTVIKEFNPMISEESCDRLLQAVLVWLRLCVYEDKLARVVSMCQSGANEDIVKELDTKTVWDTLKHPYWLVFEVENAIMIRQEQYKVTQHLIDNPGDIIQLNMGLGKTRVILPMLVMYYSYTKADEKNHSRDKITRLHFLSALFEEAFRFLQNHLTASILCIKFYAMPFCRDFQLDAAAIARMKSVLNDCRVDGGALIVAPEHRLSLELKAKELYRSEDKEIATAIEGIIKADIWRDILDECDELLRHRYQLIYAIGTPIPLPSGQHRWRAVQAIFDALAQNAELKSYMLSNEEACKLAEKSSERWPELQFFDGTKLNIMLGDYSDRHFPRQNDGLFSSLTDTILNNPPHELHWMKDHPMSQEIKKTIVEKDYDPVLDKLPEEYLSDVLALRGLIAGGVLRHCLLKRHRVNFGVARPGKKRLAVPFRFADTPDERSEFAHPDCAIAFTVLAYYHDGLSKHELKEALELLMTLGNSAQHNFYNRWLETSTDQMKREGDDVRESLNSVEKIDLTNDVQLDKMHDIFHKNMRTIDFYLNNCVLPLETDQFDSRLTATAWNIAQNPSNDIVGFSGTNDNWRILPLQVNQFFASHHKDADPILKDLDATNGKMIETIMSNTLDVVQLGQESELSLSLVNIIQKRRYGSMHAIIDCGALLAGADLNKIAKNILAVLHPGEFGGVLFYDEGHHDWVVLERSGRVLPKDLSPITEKDAFAIFDEPRCRGTDLKLRPDAIAVLTLAPGVCKDKLMQSAGRLRKLGRGQKIVLAGGSDVFTKLKDLRQDNGKSMLTSLYSWAKRGSFEATASDVLAWSMKNTVEATSAGLLNWANQAFFFASTFGKDPLLSITDEVLALDDMYGKSFSSQSVISSTNTALKYHLGRTGGEGTTHTAMTRIVGLTLERINEYGGDFTFSVRGCDEECERELEMEVEEEEEIEVEIPSVDPNEEERWNFEKAFCCNNPRELPTTIHLLPSFIEKFIRCAGTASINWSKNIFTTSNFAKTISSASGNSLSCYLRVVNFLIRFPDESILLVSEYEANHLLKLFQNSNIACSGGSYHFLHASFLRRSLDQSNEILLHCLLPKQATAMNSLFERRLSGARDLITEKSMSSLQLFAGDPTYATEERKDAIKALLRVLQKGDGKRFCPLTEARNLVDMRGYGKLFPYSDLEKVCEQLLCEINTCSGGNLTKPSWGIVVVGSVLIVCNLVWSLGKWM